ncbi:patatin-like phospholipase family protein, partial [Rhizobium leguminosarum]
NRMESIFGSGQLMMQTAISLKLKLRPPHIFLRPTVGRTGVMDMGKSARTAAAKSDGDRRHIADRRQFRADDLCLLHARP